VEIAHLYSVFDDFPTAADLRRLRRAADRYDLEVKLRREPRVQPEFLLAEKPSFIQGRGIEETEIDGLLDLVGEVAGEDDERDVRLDYTNGLHWVRIASRIA
jgi:hypothetical protein